MNNILERLKGLFSSMKLAILLLMVTALVSVLGTFIPQEQEASLYVARYGGDGYRWLKLFGLIDLYHSWGFRILTALLTANIVVCTYRRLRGIIRRTFSPVVERSPSSIQDLKLHNILPDPRKAYVIERALSEKGYRPKRDGRHIYGAKGWLGLWGDMVSHASIVLVIMGAFVGSLGYVATVNVYENDYTDKVYDWNEGRDVFFGYRLYVDSVSLQYYPVRIKVVIRERSSGSGAGTLEMMEGRLVKIPGTRYAVVADDVDFLLGTVQFRVFEGDRLRGLYDTAYPDGGPLAPLGFDYVLFMVSHGEPTLMSAGSSVRLVRDGRIVKQGVVMINDPLRFEGISIYQTSYGNDEAGRMYSGLQITRDPGVLLVLAGFGFLLVGLTLSFTVHNRQVWVYVGDNELVMGGYTNKDWQGFMREYGGLVKSYMQEVED